MNYAKPKPDTKYTKHKKMKRFKFLRINLKSENGNMAWKFGKWEKFEGELEMCKAGFHCSIEPYDAFSYVQGEILAEVEVRGESEKQDDKEVWSEMRLIKAWKWNKKASLKLAIFSAELVLKNFEKEFSDDKRPREAIEAARKVLFRNTAKNRAAAESAARSAWSAAESAWSAVESARSAAESARSARSAWSAAESAWSAAESARSAWSAAESARSAAESARSAWSAWSAARSAWSAAESAWSAAESARSAWSAAESARSAWSAWSAAIKKIRKKFVEITKELKPYQESRWVK